MRSQSALLADDRAIFVAPHLATLIEAGDDPATAELDPETGAILRPGAIETDRIERVRRALDH